MQLAEAAASWGGKRDGAVPGASAPPGEAQPHGVRLQGAPTPRGEQGTGVSEWPAVARHRVPTSAARQRLHELIARGISDSVNDPLEEMRGKNIGGK